MDCSNFLPRKVFFDGKNYDTRSFADEILNVVGFTGDHNLRWAFASPTLRPPPSPTP